MAKSDVEEMESELRKKVKSIEDSLLKYSSEEHFSLLETDYFRMYYNHLVSFNKFLQLPGVKIQHSLEFAEAEILQKVVLLTKTVTSSDTNAEKVAESLVKMKFFAENFSMFDRKINELIDEALKSHKIQRGSFALSNLTMLLEKSDLGIRLIAEHSCLSGEDWRRRRQKMQKQDDLEYVIKNLEGDELARDTLRSRYKTFRRTYDELISTNLQAFDSMTKLNPDLNILLSRIKAISRKVARSLGDVMWCQLFKDNNPELLAHVFAV